MVSGEFGRERDDEAVVDGDPEEDTESVKEGERCCRDFEGWTKFGVHGFTLEDIEVAHLAVHSGEHYSCGPYWKKAQDGF